MNIYSYREVSNCNGAVSSTTTKLAPTRERYVHPGQMQPRPEMASYDCRLQVPATLGRGGQEGLTRTNLRYRISEGRA